MNATTNLTRLQPNFRAEGAGPGVVCLHANASTSGQWRTLMAQLAPSFRVLAPDLYGAGGSPAWDSQRAFTLKDEADFIEPMLAAAGEPLVLVGHSYGAATALIATLANPGRVRALALYEPVLFSVLDQESPPPNAADGIREVVGDCSAMVATGDLDRAAERFIDYWMIPGAWRHMPDRQKPAIAASMSGAHRWGEALFNEPTPLGAFASLDIPVLYMTGRRSTASALGVARLLTGVLPRVTRVDFDDLGHMGPVTHPDVVNAAIGSFLATVG